MDGLGPIKAKSIRKSRPQGLIVNVSAFDVPPPGAGLDTVTCAVPACEISEAGIVACRLVLPTKVVLT